MLFAALVEPHGVALIEDAYLRSSRMLITEFVHMRKQTASSMLITEFVHMQKQTAPDAYRGDLVDILWRVKGRTRCVYSGCWNAVRRARKR